MARIGELKERYKGEWLAIHILKEGASGPEEGELLYHARDADEIWKLIQGDRRRIYVTYAGPPLPEGHAAAF